MTERRKILHLLNRLTFGPRPGDVELVARMGAQVFIEQQLHPEQIPDTACDHALSQYPWTRMSAEEISAGYPDVYYKMYREKHGARVKSDMQRSLYGDLSAAKLTRAALSERQLLEVMTDFWFNHFNVNFSKDWEKPLVGPYERDVIRPHALGRFRDLLGAVAHSPAMLLYLDNDQSSRDPRYSRPASSESSVGAKPEKSGLNENYARELLELHTIGVHAGYSQKDVTEAARVLTGWSIANPSLYSGRPVDFSFQFKPEMHDPDGKVILGQPIAGDGEQEGERLLDMLARHPSTAHFIAYKLCRRFVADEPPAPLVDLVAERFRTTDGDIRQSLDVLFHAPEFYDPVFFRAKIKSPFEFWASVLRATGAGIDDPVAVGRVFQRLGQQPYRCEPPTGYSETAEAWISAGDLMMRINEAMRLLDREKAHLTTSASPEDGGAVLQSFVDDYLGGEISERTRSAILERLDHPVLWVRRAGGRRVYKRERIAGLVLGSPDFQRR